MEQTLENFSIPTSMIEFLQWDPVDGFKYEWNDGKVVQFGRMNRRHLRLIQVLMDVFDQTDAYKNGGILVTSQDVMLDEAQLRRPDFAFFNKTQIDNSSEIEPIPEFTIEVISTNDQINPVKAKVREYFAHGVKVVWLIYPEEKLVEVYTAYKQVKICSDNDICSADPVLSDFKIEAHKLFE